MSLSTKAVLSVFVLSAIVGGVIYVAAGTIDYWQAWIYLLVFTITSLLITWYLIQNDPELLERRMRGGPLAEKRPAQRVIMWFTSLAFLGLLVVPGLDHRFGWSRVPFVVIVTADALVAIGFYLIFRVYRENTYTSATIEIAANQRVIDSGPYALVRHPMYGAALLYLLGTPLALGSYWGVLPFVLVVGMIVWRLVDEEEALRTGLKDYAEYQQRVRFRLIPHIW
jgi:protein-S-isoprenylcysteine O-methyltransferase Ste14